MKALKFLAVSVAVVGLLTVSALAAHNPDMTAVQAEQARIGFGDGSLQGVGGVRDLGNDCGTVEDIGTLGGGATAVPYSVAGFDDSFPMDTSGTCPPPCGWYTDAIDGILAFQVSITGTWTISACDDGNDNSLQLRANGVCPGTDCIAQDDDSCDGGCWAPYQAEIAGITLTAGVQYYLIVEFGIGNLVFNGPCAIDDDCDDGSFCSGVETCVAGACVAGTYPCTPYQYCDDGIDECVDPDSCIVWQLYADSGYFIRPGPGIPLADDWFLDKMCDGTALVSYDVGVFGHPGYGCTAYNVNMELWSNTTNLVCTGDWVTPCTVQADCDAGVGGDCVTDYYPGAAIPDTACSYAALPTGGWMLHCEPTGVLCPESVDPGFVPDAWVVTTFSDDSPDPGGCSGPFIAGVDPPEIGWSDNLYAIGDGAGGWGLTWFGGDPPAHFVGDMCCDPCGPCCEADGACSMVEEADCTGTYYGDATVYNGLACADDVQGCCFADDTCMDADVFCCLQMGGTPMGAGTVCGGMEACCYPDMTCTMADALCCVANGGMPGGAGSTCGGMGGCCYGGNCVTADATCCLNDGATPAAACEGDADGDFVDGSCGDECPGDPAKLLPGICGCGTPDIDTDGDGVMDCDDECPGVDDAIFAPGCGPAIPTVSEWGVVILALLLLAAGKVYFSRRQTC